MSALVAGTPVWVRRDGQELKGWLVFMSDRGTGQVRLLDSGEIVEITHREVSLRREEARE